MPHRGQSRRQSLRFAGFHLKGRRLANRHFRNFEIIMSSILVIGGGSRVASAMRSLYPGSYDFLIRGDSLPAQPAKGTFDLPPTQFHPVGSYADLTAEDFGGYRTVINLVGTNKGSPDQLMAVNGELLRHFAEQAVQAGVTHFIALSSFSVYGFASSINADTPIAPTSAYGRSRVAGERNLERFSGQMACTIARCPILYGAGESKLEKLIAAWGKIGVLPAPADPVHRSMVHYELAARYLHEVAHSDRVQPGLHIDLFADPVPFEYGRTVQIISQATGARKRLLPLPSFARHVFVKLAPQIARSMYCDSVLVEEQNYFRDRGDSRIENDIAAIASQMQSAE